MEQSIKITFHPSNQTLRVAKGTTILDAARQASVKIRSECGGHGKCGKCKVGIIPSNRRKQTSSLTETETDFSQLACQTRVMRELTVVVMPDPHGDVAVYGKTAIKRPDVPIDPFIKRLYLNISSLLAGDVEKQRDLISLFREKVRSSTGQDIFCNDVGILRQLSVCDPYHDELTLVCHASHGVMNVFDGIKKESFGVAIDVGTTTIAAYLCDLRSGEVIASEGVLNPQSHYGEDVISRISFADRENDGLTILRSILIQALNRLISACLKSANVSCDDVDDVTIVGNPTMEHILAGLHPKLLGKAPYLPVVRQFPDQKASDFDFDLPYRTNVFIFPVVSGFVGGDLLAAILAEDAHHRPETCLVVDIGTNGEVALVTPQGILSTSCATGPAFEGGQLACGMRAAVGAVYEVTLNETPNLFSYRIMADDPDEKAAGICGSGIIDAIAVMCRSGVIDPGGRLNENKDIVIRDQNGIGRKIFIVPPEKSKSPQGVYITLHDIRQIQLAKAAMNVGIQCLLQLAGLPKVAKVVLTGAFGVHFNYRNAIEIGMFPKELMDSKFETRENLAGTGAIMALLNKRKRQGLNYLLDRIQSVDLLEHSDFTDKFSQATRFDFHVN